MNCRPSKFALITAVLSLSAFGVSVPTASAEQGYVQYHDLTSPPPLAPVILDSFMKPIHVRQRTTIDAATGVEEHVVEPLIMERYERVLRPSVAVVEKTTDQTVTRTETRSQPRVARRTVARRSVAYRPRAKTMASRRKATHIAVRRTARPVSVASRTTQRTVETNQVATTYRVVERRDPVLNVLDHVPNPRAVAGRVDVILY